MAICPHCTGKFEEGSTIYPCKHCNGSLCTACYFEDNCPTKK